MNRYTTKHFWRMNQDSNGAWVRYSEVETLKSQHQDQIADLNQEIDQLNADIKFCKDCSAYDDSQACKEFTEKLYYKSKLELIGNFATVLTIAGVIGCLVYSFGW